MTDLGRDFIFPEQSSHLILSQRRSVRRPLRK